MPISSTNIIRSSTLTVIFSSSGTNCTCSAVHCTLWTTKCTLEYIFYSFSIIYFTVSHTICTLNAFSVGSSQLTIGFIMQYTGCTIRNSSYTLLYTTNPSCGTPLYITRSSSYTSVTGLSICCAGYIVGQKLYILDHNLYGIVTELYISKLEPCGEEY